MRMHANTHTHVHYTHALVLARHMYGDIVSNGAKTGAYENDSQEAAQAGRQAGRRR